MAIPARNADPEKRSYSSRTFFATTKTYNGRRLLQSELYAGLLIDVLRSCVAAREFRLHDFVIMPDHVHLLITVEQQTTIEKAMQLIKGRFSFLLKKQHDYLGEVWQRGFSEVRVDDKMSFARHREYIAQNPVEARLSTSADEYPYCFRFLAKKKHAGAKAPPFLMPPLRHE